MAKKTTKTVTETQETETKDLTPSTEETKTVTETQETETKEPVKKVIKYKTNRPMFDNVGKRIGHGEVVEFKRLAGLPVKKLLEEKKIEKVD